MRDPADRPAHRERRREHLAWESDGLHDHAGIELDVAGQRAVGLEFGERRQDLGLDRDRPLDQLAAQGTGHVAEQCRARVGRSIHGMTEPHDATTGGDLTANPVRRPVRRHDRVEGFECTTRSTTVERAGERTERRADHVDDVGTRRGDDTAGEGRRVEAVVDREDEVLLERPRVHRVGRSSRHLVEIGGRMAEIRVEGDGGEAGSRAIQRTEDRRHDGRDVEGLLATVGRIEIEQGFEPERAGRGREHGAEPGERSARQRGDHVDQRRDSVGQSSTGGDVGSESGPFGGVGETAPVEEVPDVLERGIPRQLDGVVVAVVVEAFVAEHGADGGVGDGHTVESCGNVDQVHAPSVRRRRRLINVDSINVDGVHHPGDPGVVTTMIGSSEAARLLGVSKPTLYAYVSRGLVERHTAVDGRTSLYPREQIEQLATRGRSKAPVERPSIDVRIGSSITLLDDVALRYRGRDVAELARTRSFEEVGELLWTGDLPERPVVWSVDRARLDRCVEVAGPLIGESAVAALGAAAHALSANTPGNQSGGHAARTLAAVAPSLVGGPKRGSVAERLTKAYVRRPSPELVTAVDRALVLLADHELATSTLAVRVACSVRADPFAAIAAGLSVVSGPLHGGASVETADLIALADVDGAAATVDAYLDRGRRLPGFGHSVYRRGDPRVAPLLEAVRNVPGATRTVELVDEIIAGAGRRLAHLPNVDLALGALLHAGGFPADAPLFAVARLAGWGAHYDEETTERPVRFRGLTQLR